MTILPANDINSLYNISSDAIKNTLCKTTDTDAAETTGGESLFGSIFNAAVSNISDTNNLLSDMENEELKWSMGISENTHDLSIAVGKAQTAFSYTVALRDKLLEAYREIMQIQI